MAKQTKLSINLNKIALIRNSRSGDFPNLSKFAERVLQAGADGLTLHPRPDQRHARPNDCKALQTLIEVWNEKKPAQKNIELNIEGNPLEAACKAMNSSHEDYPSFVSIIENTLPDQVTLVPDNQNQLTSDHGFDLSGDNGKLAELIAYFKSLKCRVSLFMAPDENQIRRAADIGADRIELYTGPYAWKFGSTEQNAEFSKHQQAAKVAHNLGLGINAGHDLNLDNLSTYAKLEYLDEVSIGHAFTVDALHLGLEETIKQYQQRLQ